VGAFVASITVAWNVDEDANWLFIDSGKLSVVPALKGEDLRHHG
jgi:hypothetical protein